MPAKSKQTPARGRAALKKTSSSKDGYTVRVTNVSTGTEQDLDLPLSARHRNYSLWPAFTAYIIGFALLGLSFIAQTLRLYGVFAILLSLSAGLVLGTMLVRALRGR